MAFIDTTQLLAIERLPGWRGSYFNSPSMMFAHYEFDAGASIHEHSHEQEEVYEIVEGELKLRLEASPDASVLELWASFRPILCIR